MKKKDKLVFNDGDSYSYRKQLEGLNKEELIEKGMRLYRSRIAIYIFAIFAAIIAVVGGLYMGLYGDDFEDINQNCDYTTENQYIDVVHILSKEICEMVGDEGVSTRVSSDRDYVEIICLDRTIRVKGEIKD